MWVHNSGETTTKGFTQCYAHQADFNFVLMIVDTHQILGITTKTKKQKKPKK